MWVSRSLSSVSGWLRLGLIGSRSNDFRPNGVELLPKTFILMHQKLADKVLRNFQHKQLRHIGLTVALSSSRNMRHYHSSSMWQVQRAISNFLNESLRKMTDQLLSTLCEHFSKQHLTRFLAWVSVVLLLTAPNLFEIHFVAAQKRWRHVNLKFEGYFDLVLDGRLTR